MAEDDGFTRKVLDRWRDAADRCWNAIDEGQEDLEALQFTSFPSWGPGQLLVEFDLLASMLGRLLARREINPEPFFRAVECARTYHLAPDGAGAQDSAIAAIRAGLAFAAVHLGRLGDDSGGPTPDPPKPPKRARRGRPPIDLNRNDMIIREYFDMRCKPAAIAERMGISIDVVRGVIRREKGRRG